MKSLMASKIFTKRIDIPVTQRQWDEIHSAFALAKQQDETLVLRPWLRSLLLETADKLIRSASKQEVNSADGIPSPGGISPDRRGQRGGKK